MIKDLVLFSELEISLTEDLAKRIERHSGQTGSIFPHKSQAMKDLKICEGHVKYTKGKIDYDTRCQGFIPKPDGSQMKITEAALKSYVDQHKDTVGAIKEEAEAIKHLDDCRALANVYLDVTDQLKLLQSIRTKEFYGGDTTLRAKDTETGLTNFDQK